MHFARLRNILETISVTIGGVWTFSGTLRLSGALRGNLRKITTTSVLTTTVLTAADAGKRILIATGTSLSLARHRLRLPSATSGTSGAEFCIVSGITGTPTSNGIMVSPTTGTSDRIQGTTAKEHGLKGSTLGKVGAMLALASDGDGGYWITGRGLPIEQANTSKVWATTA